MSENSRTFEGLTHNERKRALGDLHRARLATHLGLDGALLSAAIRTLEALHEGRKVEEWAQPEVLSPEVPSEHGDHGLDCAQGASGGPSAVGG